jgi:hypothetical protein
LTRPADRDPEFSLVIELGGRAWIGDHGRVGARAVTIEDTGATRVAVADGDEAHQSFRACRWPS